MKKNNGVDEGSRKLILWEAAEGTGVVQSGEKIETLLISTITWKWL